MTEAASTSDIFERPVRDTPYVALFRDMVRAARSARASDIHVQPEREGLVVRFRVNGELEVWKRLAIHHRYLFINEAKRLSNLSIGVSGRPQDGRASFPGLKLDVRASLLPSQFGEKLVLRLLDLTRNFSFEDLDLDEETLAELQRALSSKHGVVLISGPTGSGKTTTLYTMLSSLNRSRMNVVTLEDPIEYGIDGITQVQVSEKMTFAGALRSVLRQDPDVILVGEIRDAETADLCVKAASTGHLVLSTVHANGAPEAIDRIVQLGVDSFSVRSILRFSAAQRLLQRVCPSCSVACTKEAAEKLVQAGVLESGVQATCNSYKRRNEDGCERCSAGILGRVPIIEFVRGSDLDSWGAGPHVHEIQCRVTLQAAALRKAQKGEVDYRDVLKVE